MEKIVLSTGYEFELIPNAVHETSNGEKLTVTFKPGDKTAEELLKIWSGNDTITAKIDETTIQVHKNFTSCASVSVIPNYLVGTKYVCPECGTEVESDATTCPNCNATFEAPTMEEIRETVCTVICVIPDLTDRVTDVESSVDDIINTILG